METKHKTLAECKDEVAKQYSYMGKQYNSWEAMQNRMLYDVPESSKRSALKDLMSRSNEAAELYASEENRKKEEPKKSDPVIIKNLGEKLIDISTSYDLEDGSVILAISPVVAKKFILNLLQSQQPVSIQWLSDNRIKELSAHLNFRLNDAFHNEGMSTNGIIGAFLKEIQTELRKRVNVVDPVELMNWINKENYEKIHGDRWCKQFMSQTHSSEELLKIYLTSKTK